MSGSLLAALLLAPLGITPAMIAERGLVPHEEPPLLVIAAMDGDRIHYLTPDAAHAFHSMQYAAAEDGVELILVSAFRSIQAQVNIIRRKLDAGESIQHILTVNAPPGYSEHHTGRAVDVGTPGVTDLSEDFERTAAFDWLGRNAHRFGFVLSYPRDNPQGYAYEPWHWVFTNRSDSPVRIGTVEEGVRHRR